MNPCRLDPSTAVPHGTIKSVLGSILLVLSVPKLLELGIKQVISIFQRDVIRATASRGHVRRVLDRQGEDALQAGFTHSMAT